MIRFFAAASLLVFCAHANAEIGTALNCDGNTIPQPLVIGPSMVPAVAYELRNDAHQRGAPRSSLALSGDEGRSVDQVLQRLRSDHCQPAIAAPDTGYVKRTEFDNTPYRFNAGTGFTAAEFEAWMKERGIRIVNGRAVVGGAPAQAESAPDEVPVCQHASVQGETTALSC